MSHTYDTYAVVHMWMTLNMLQAMIPLWMFPLALVCGNTYIIKPSEKDPGACMKLVELGKEAGIPNGCVNVIHGMHESVNFICDNPDILAISFVGSDKVGKYIYERGSKSGKRVQANLGAKNHGVIMPDANKEHTLTQVRRCTQIPAKRAFCGMHACCCSVQFLVSWCDKWANVQIWFGRDTKHEPTKKIRVAIFLGY